MVSDTPASVLPATAPTPTTARVTPPQPASKRAEKLKKLQQQRVDGKRCDATPPASKRAEKRKRLQQQRADGKRRRREHTFRPAPRGPRPHDKFHVLGFPPREHNGPLPEDLPRNHGLSAEQQARVLERHEADHTLLRHNQGFAGIRNPDRKKNDPNTPIWAAFRLNRVMSKHVNTLLPLIDEIKTNKSIINTTKTHGGNFHQTWIGVWARYQKHVYLTANQITARQNPNIRPSLERFLRELDSSLNRASRSISRLDPDTFKRMKYSHRHLSRHINSSKVMKATEDDEKAINTGRSIAFLRGNKKLVRRNCFFRMGGMGTVMSISSGDTGFHYDAKDDRQHYSIIVILGKGGILDLPELGYKIEVEEGDVIGLLAGQQLHRLIAARSGSYVITIWTDRGAIKLAKGKGYDGKDEGNRSKGKGKSRGKGRAMEPEPEPELGMEMGPEPEPEPEPGLELELEPEELAGNFEVFHIADDDDSDDPDFKPEEWEEVTDVEEYEYDEE